MTRYFVHHESCSAWAQSDDAPDDLPDLVEELDEDQYRRVCEKYHLKPKDENGNYLL